MKKDFSSFLSLKGGFSLSSRQFVDFFKKRGYLFFLKAILFSLLFCLLFAFFAASHVEGILQSNPIFLSIEDLPQKKVGLVFGAGYQGGRVSGILADRLNGAIQAYAQGKFTKFLVSWDNSTYYHNEVVVMQKYLLEKGIPQEDIVLDYAGFDTYDSLYRARDVFETRSLILFTQAYHLPRALYIAKNLNLDAVGYATDENTYVNMRFFAFREFFAKVKAFLEVEIFHPEPHFLWPKIPIL